MARTTTHSRRIAAAAVPLALVSAAWTAHLAATGPAATGSAVPPAAPSERPDARPADTARLQGAPVDHPASLSDPDAASVADGRDVDAVVPAVAGASIPSSALAAYQRAETVINAADPSCHLQWQLVAAIGRVESDHGRFAGSVLDAQGVARPAITGPRLDGRHGTSSIADTDAGQYDADRRFDRAVGPMQFIPSTWAVVGVDADNDGVRDPQDVDDAALAAAVYLCSGDDDLAEDAGRRAAVHRYNHSDPYVDLVLAIMDGYLEGGVGAAPSPATVSAGYVGPPIAARPLAGPAVPDLAPDVDLQAPGGASGPRGPRGPGGPGGQDLAGPGPADEDADLGPAPAPQPAAPEPDEPAGPAQPTDPEPADPSEPEPTEPEPEPTEPEPSEPPADVQPGSLSVEDAVSYCRELGLVDDPATPDYDYDTCLTTYVVPGLPLPDGTAPRG